MLKKRSIRAINFCQFASCNQVKFIRRRKNGKVQTRRHVLTDQEHSRLISRVNGCAIRSEGAIYVWCNGWTFYPNDPLTYSA